MYRVRCRIVSVDGHIVEGSVNFTVKSPRGGNEPRQEQEGRREASQHFAPDDFWSARGDGRTGILPVRPHPLSYGWATNQISRTLWPVVSPAFLSFFQ